MAHQFSKGDIVREKRTGTEAEIVAPDATDEALFLCRFVQYPKHQVNFRADDLELVRPAGGFTGRTTGGPVLDIKAEA